MAYLSVDKIAVIRLQLHKVLPAVYDESLSYLEGLSKLTYKLNETIGAVNALNDNVDTLNDRRISQMRGKRSCLGATIPSGDRPGAKRGGNHGDPDGLEAGAGTAPWPAHVPGGHDAGHQTVCPVSV